jgi:uncharacterized membrane protein
MRRIKSRVSNGYTSRVLLILVALGLAIFGVVRLAHTLEPRQRIVLVLVFVVAIVWLVLKLVQVGLLGRLARESSH